jgi:5-methylcytosine-specific restriction endonuclease McrA
MAPGEGVPGCHLTALRQRLSMKRKKQRPHPDFNLPGRSKLTGRKSTLTGLFLNSVTPVVEPTASEVDRALDCLGMQSGSCVCAYCGGHKSEWDHFRPIVIDRKPTGFITEIANLVPSCGKCNQSKGNKPWREWISGNARHSPKTRNIADLDERIRRLDQYERSWTPVQLDYAQICGEDTWGRHLGNLDQVLTLLQEAEDTAEKCRDVVAAHLSKMRSNPPG